MQHCAPREPPGRFVLEKRRLRGEMRRGLPSRRELVFCCSREQHNGAMDVSPRERESSFWREERLEAGPSGSPWGAPGPPSCLEGGQAAGPSSQALHERRRSLCKRRHARFLPAQEVTLPEASPCSALARRKCVTAAAPGGSFKARRRRLRPPVGLPPLRLPRAPLVLARPLPPPSGRMERCEGRPPRSPVSPDGGDKEEDAAFERFLSRMKTPRSVSARRTPSGSGSCSWSRAKDSKEDFLSYLASKYGSAKREAEPQKGASRSMSLPPPLALSDTDSGDDSVFVTPRKPPPSRLGGPWGSRPPASSSQKDRVPRKKGPNSSLSLEERGFKENRAPGSVRSWQREMRETSGSESSDEEIASLAVRVKQAMVFSPRKSALRLSSPFEERGPRPSPRSLLPATKKEPSQPPGPDPSTSAQAPKNKALADVTQLHQTQPPRGRSSCQIPGCFLEELSDPESQPSRLFRSQKEKLAQDLYAFYNTSVFEEKLPGRMEILWNKKMRKTAGCCVSGQQKEPGRQRYARIMLSEKVCDSADRLRDTLIHELCHAATWLIHGVRDGHGRFWNLYAKKAAIVHPELPVVSRCHNYEIKYKFTYECIRCRNTIGRHSKSLDTQRFVCALCQGQLVLRQPMRKDGTPAERPLTPFAKYVKENYGSVKRLQPGLSHGAVMKKLGVGFASQERGLSA